MPIVSIDDYNYDNKNIIIMKNRKTQRGFDITEFEDAYGAKCSLQKSSSAMEDKIWFGVNDADPKIMVSKAKENGLEPQGNCGWMTYPIPKDVLLNTRMHLNRTQVAELLPYLQRFVETGELSEIEENSVNELDDDNKTEILANFCRNIAKQENCPDEFIDAVNKEFWNLV